MSDQLLKIVLVGDAGVGKTSLINKFYSQKYMSTVPTVGVDYKIIKNVKLNNKKTYQISVWDTAGQEQFRSIVKLSCTGADGAIVCYDLNNQNALQNVEEWVEYVRENSTTHLQIILVGTKCDLKHMVDPKEIVKLQQQLNLLQDTRYSHSN